MGLRRFCTTHTYDYAESFPVIDINIGPGSMAVYLGAEPVFAWDTVWYTECVENGWEHFGLLRYDDENYWWKRHLELIHKAQQLSGGNFVVNIPDIVENVDILSAMREPQAFCYDIIDNEDLIKDYVKQVDELYFKFYDAIYDIVKLSDGSGSYTSFAIWGFGKTAKVQCDFSALMSPVQFRELAQDSLKKQCSMLDNSLYHLDKLYYGHK